MIHQHIEGLVAAPFTPMNPDGSINLDIIESQANSLAANKVVGAFLCGTTGQSLSLSVSERKRIMTRWAEVAPEQLKVIAHVGHCALPAAIDLALHAQELGLHATGAMPPVFFKPQNINELVAWCVEIANAAPRLPFYYYHLPSMTGVDLPMVDFLNAAKDKIPNLVGIKFTHHNLSDLTSCLTLDDGRFDMLFGRDEALLAGLALGVKGAVGSTYNFAAPLYIRLIEAFAQNDLDTARKLQQISIDMVNIIAATPCSFQPAAKSILKMIGLDLGGVRQPLQNITESQYKDLKTRLEKINFFDYACK